MLEKVILDYLDLKLVEPVYMEQPEDNTDEEYVIIERTGSGKSNQVSSATFAIQSYGGTLYKAALLNEKVLIAMDRINELDEIAKVSLNTYYNFTDQTKKKYRYQAVFDLVYY